MLDRSVVVGMLAVAFALPLAVGQRGAVAETKVHATAKTADNAAVADGPSYTKDGRLKFPSRYREWIFLTSGFNMSYNPAGTAEGESVFDNVFVNPSAYRSFLKTGVWPDKTVLVLENRRGEGRRSINQRGKTQATAVIGMEAHVKDTSRAKGGWAFYSFDDKISAKAIPRSASCYSCHQAHGAVATTFVQFYPTLMSTATRENTLSAEFRKDLDAASRLHAH